MFHTLADWREGECVTPTLSKRKKFLYKTQECFLSSFASRLLCFLQGELVTSILLSLVTSVPTISLLNFQPLPIPPSSSSQSVSQDPQHLFPCFCLPWGFVGLGLGCGFLNISCFPRFWVDSSIAVAEYAPQSQLTHISAPSDHEQEDSDPKNPFSAAVTGTLHKIPTAKTAVCQLRC